MQLSFILHQKWKHQKVIILKVYDYEKVDSTHFKKEQRLVSLLASCDIAALQPLEFGFIRKKEPVRIYSFIDSARVDITSPFYWQQVGTILSRLHEIPPLELNSIIQKDSDVKENWQVELQRTSQHLPFFYKRYGTQLAEKIRNLSIPENLKPGVTYGRAVIPILLSKSDQPFLLNLDHIQIGFSCLEALAVLFKAAFYGPLCEEAFTTAYGREKLTEFSQQIDPDLAALNRIMSTIQNWNDVFESGCIQQLEQVWKIYNPDKEYVAIRNDLRQLCGYDSQKSVRFYINKQSNEYGDLPKKFKEPLPTSIIIPSKDHNKLLKQTLVSLQKNKEINKYKDRVELIIVDDYSKQKIVDMKALQDLPVKTTVLRAAKNVGRSQARNIGVQHANGELFIFLDSDVIIGHPNFLSNHWLVHSLPHAVGVGLCEKISENDPRLLSHKVLLSRSPQLINDYRCRNYNPQTKTFPVLQGTRFFRDLGYGNTQYDLPLPFWTATFELSVTRKAFQAVGGFDQNFQGWGVEDNHFAAKLIAAGYHMIPVLPVSVFRVIHPIRDGDEPKRAQSYYRNRLLYEMLLDENIENLDTLTPVDIDLETSHFD